METDVRGKEIDRFNKKAKEEFEMHGGINLLTKYVMSETLPPIEDYENAVNIIRANYHSQISGELLIIGAYLAIQWTHSTNEILEILNLMYPYLPEKEKSIVNYLNAQQLYIRDANYLTNEAYRDELIKSIGFNVPFVNNHCKLAEILPLNEARRYYEYAMKNIVKVNSEEEIMDMTIENFINPDSFINEFILGTDISWLHFDEIKKKLDYCNRY